MRSLIASVAAFAVAGFIGMVPVHAASVTPDVIFGSGNANGSFTVGTGGGVEIGLRAKQRFPAANIFNYDGTKTYDFVAGEAPGDPTRSLWNFEWSINTDFDSTTGSKLDDFTYSMELDFDPGPGTTFNPFIFPTVFDPIKGASFFDHALGDNTTGNGGGSTASDAADYASKIGSLNVAQNSWTYSFFPFLGPFDPNTPGIYTISLTAFGTSGAVASSTIDVVVSAVPVPAALPLLLSGLIGLGAIGWRRRKAA